MMHLSNADQATLKATKVFLAKFSCALSNARIEPTQPTPDTQAGQKRGRQSEREVGLGIHDRSVLNETKRILKTKTLKKSYPKIGPAKNPKNKQIRTGPGGAKFPDLAAVKIWSLFN